ncbi:hypothetical protein HU200_023010 [Digitaria exilis]|uniref:Uncharacterized protein n=1 Tax=Digitaria exilis TaxID=1010633 RepID=A0A835C242_9POAL|nr:hypothetical protein HU200_023010 [Digitaria exilis]
MARVKSTAIPTSDAEREESLEASNPGTSSRECHEPTNYCPHRHGSLDCFLRKPGPVGRPMCLCIDWRRFGPRPPTLQSSPLRPFLRLSTQQTGTAAREVGRGRKMSSSSSVETHARAFADEVRGGLDTKNWVLALGHPLLNRIAESFVKAAGVSTPRWLTGSVHSVLDQSPISFPCPVSSQARFHCFCRGREGVRETYFMAIEGTKTLPVLLFVFPLFLSVSLSEFLAREDQCPAPLARGNARSRNSLYEHCCCSLAV